MQITAIGSLSRFSLDVWTSRVPTQWTSIWMLKIKLLGYKRTYEHLVYGCYCTCFVSVVLLSSKTACRMLLHEFGSNLPIQELSDISCIHFMYAHKHVLCAFILFVINMVVVFVWSVSIVVFIFSSPFSEHMGISFSLLKIIIDIPICIQ